jgi:AcrR family transcriptional regulator
LPKIIRNVEEKILKAACELFQENGYRNCDMKSIAARAGTAIGNIYRYYRSKDELFVESMKSSLMTEIDLLERSVDSSQSAREKLLKFLKGIYGIMEKKIDLFEEYVTEREALPGINLEILLEERLIEILSELDPLPEGCKDRVATCLLVSILVMLRRFPGEGEKNLRFMEFMLNGLLLKRE